MNFSKEEWDKINILKGILIFFVVLGHALVVIEDMNGREIDEIEEDLNKITKM